MSTQLKDLIGLHLLDAVDFENVSLPAYEGADYNEDANTCRFRLDGTVWCVVEDPSDGYRSSMREIVRSRKKPVNVFPAIQVLAVIRERNGYNSCDLLELIDTQTAKVVLVVGTDNNDDYYPSFVANFSPENMASNVGASP